MLRPPSLNAPDSAPAQAASGAGEYEIYLEPRFCPEAMPRVRGDLQQDIIDMMKPLDNDKIKEGMPDTEFNRKYPPDVWWEEAAPNARVWKICRDEATASDRDMLDSWNKTLDVLLIFAGLFSAVSTAFIIESYKTLQPDYSQYVADFLYSAAVAYNSSGTALPPLDAIRSPQGSFQRSAGERWINGLWFISLAVSLFVALLSILVKQWLDEYRACVSRSAPDHAYWARRHAMYHQGLQSWGVAVLISCLPLLLHLSLFLFLAGLVLFLRLLDEVIAGVLLAMVALILSLYLLSMAMPAYYLVCPSRTPVLTQALHAWSACLASLAKLASILHSPQRTVEGIKRWASAVSDREAQALLRSEDALTAAAVAGLVDSTDDTDVMAVVAEATSELAPSALTLLMHERNDVFVRVVQFVYSGTWITRRLYTGLFARASHARCHRSRLAVQNVSPEPWYYHGGYLRGAPHLAPALGVEGALLCALYDWEPAFSQQCGIRNLVAALRAIDWIPAAQHPGAGPEYYAPPRACVHFSVCLLFLRTAAGIAEQQVAQEGPPVRQSPFDYSPHFYSLVVLVFCAAQFAAQRGLGQEQRATAKCLVTILDASRAHAAGTAFSASDVSQRLESDPERIILRGIGALYTILADADKFNIHPDVVDLVAPYVAALSAHVYSSWAHDRALSELILCEGFARYTPSAGEVVNYARAMANAAPDDAPCSPQRLHDFLRCSSVLAARAATLQFATDQYGLLSALVRGVLPHLRRPQNERVVLSYFLEDLAVFERWMDLFWHGCPEDLLLDRGTLLARELAAALRRRKRTGRDMDDDAAWVRVLFASQSVTRVAESTLALHATSPDPETCGALSSFLTHWRDLSPSSWSVLCDHLQSTRGETSLTLEDIECFRNGLVSGGIHGDCDVDCECMLPYEPELGQVPQTDDTVPQADGGWGKRLILWLPWLWRARSAEPDGQTSSDLVAV